MQYGSGIKTLCSVLNIEEIVTINRLTKFVNCISQGVLNISNGTIVNFIKELNSKSEYIRKYIRDKLLNSELMYTDLTIAKSENRNLSIRNYLTEQYTLLVDY